MRKFFFLLMGVVVLSLATSMAVQAKTYPKQKVVYHINGENPQEQVDALRNIQNHLNALGEGNIELKVVMHGNGLSLLLYPDVLDEVKVFKNGNATDDMQARLDGLRNQGVAFLVCGNTVNGRQVIVDEHLYNVDEEDIVPSGVAELSHLQAQGFTYIL